MDDLVSRLEQASVQVHVLMDGDRSFTAIAGGDQAQPASFFLLRKTSFFIARLKPALLRQQPDLQEVHRLRGRRVELTVPDARARGDALHLARMEHRPGTQT